MGYSPAASPATEIWQASETLDAASLPDYGDEAADTQDFLS